MQVFNIKSLKILMEKHNLKQKDLQEILSNIVSKDAIISWFRTTNPSKPRENAIIKLCEYFGVESDYFYGDTDKSNKSLVPVLDMVAGFGTEGVLDSGFNATKKLFLPNEFLGSVDPRYARIIRCLGDSMEPEFKDGDYMLIELLGGRNFIKRSGIYLVRINDIIYIKRVEFLPNNDLNLISLNPIYPPFLASSTGYESEILGAVYGKISVKIGAGFQFDNQGIV